MRTFTYILVCISALACAGCQQNTNNDGRQKDLSIAIDTFTLNIWTPLCEGSEYGIEMSMNIEWPKKAITEDALVKMQKDISGLLFGSGLATTDVEFAMNAYNSNTIEQYMEENSPENAYHDEDGNYFYTNWGEDIEGKFMEPYKKMVSYLKYIYGYSGGAHGLDALNGITFDMKTGNVIRNEDLFIEGYETILTELLRARLLISIDNHDMLFEKDILPHDNFYITSTGITYIYQRYEIGPYVLGIIEVTIPWKEIQDIIRPISSQDNKLPTSPRVPS